MSQPKKYTVEVKDAPEVAGEGKPRRSAFCADKLVTGMANGAATLFENFKRGVAISGDKPCLGHRAMTNGVAGAYQWETYQQVLDRVLRFATSLSKLGLTKGSNVGIFCVNRAEWLIAEQACNSQGYVTVPLYDTLGNEAIEFIVNETKMEVVIVSNDKISTFSKERAKYPLVKTLVLLGGVSQAEKEVGEQVQLDLVGFAALEEAGKQGTIEPANLGADDLVTIMYTSGTTGLPKGVMLANKNFLSDAGSVEYLGSRGKCLNITKDDVHLSYLPLAHVFERMVVTYVLGVGAAIGFFQGNTQKLLEDIDVLKPTFFPSVPRLLNRVYDRVIASVELKGGVTSVLFHMACDSKRANLRDGYLTHWLWDRLVFSKVKARLGGRVKAIVTASAPISPEVLEFLRFAFCCEVHEAYGQTESCGGSTVTALGDYESGHVGVPFPCNDIKLVDVPEMNYTSKDTPNPRGEICFRGANVFLGYYNNPEKTQEALDADGWLHSGDIGLWDEKGRLRVIDRKKNIFKLAQGEYIAPEKIENVYAKSKYVAQAFVYGDSLKAFLVAVIIPDEEIVGPYCHQAGIPGKTLEEWIRDPKLKEVILQDMIKVGKELGLKSFEQVKEIQLDHNLFSVENNLLTPTFKLKRPQAKDHYQAQITEMIERVQKAEEAKEKKQNLEEERKA